MHQILKKSTRQFPRLGTVLLLVCTLGLAPVAKVYAETEVSSSGSSRMIPVTATTGQTTAGQGQDAEQLAVPESAAVEQPLPEPAFTAVEAEEKKTPDTDQKTLLYVGGGVAAAAALALALGGGSGSSSSPEPEPEPPPPPAKPVGADIAGDTWFGFLELVNGYREPVTAVIKQNGSDVEITTTASQRYGRSFRGKIYPNGQMLLYDQITGEDWTTFKGPATGYLIDLYDYVNNFTGLDRLYLKRR